MKCFFSSLIIEMLSRKRVNQFFLPLIFLFFALFVLNITGAKAGGHENDLSGRLIKEITIELPLDLMNQEYWQSIIKELILVKTGEPYSVDQLVESITILSVSGLFSHIDVPDPTLLDLGVYIQLNITPSARIKEINIDGAFPISQKDILSIMTITVGDAFNPEGINNQKERLISYLKNQGYIDPSVRIESVKDRTDNNYTLRITIEKGRYLKIRKVSIEGNHHIPSNRFKLKTKAWKLIGPFGDSDRFIKRNADEDIKHIIQICREKGFAQAQVKLNLVPVSGSNDINLLFSITEGPVYSFMFKGNNVFSDSELKKEIVIYKEGNLNGSGITKSIRNLKRKYLEKGFQNITIRSDSSQIRSEDLDGRQITFDISEGNQYRISNISLTGHILLSEELIRQQILSGSSPLLTVPVYIRKQLDQDMNAIKTLYLNHGFSQTRVSKTIKIKPTTEVKEIKTEWVDIEITIIEGPKTRVGSVHFSGLPQLDHEQAIDLISLKPGSPFRRFMVESDENIIKSVISEKGYPYVDIETIVTLSPDMTIADIRYQCTPGSKVRFGTIIYAGNFRTQESILRNEITFTPGSDLSIRKLLESRRNIMNINAFESVRFRTPGLKHKADEIDLIINVEEKKPYYFELGTGYDTRREIYAETSIGDHNFLGRNLDLSSRIELSQKGYRGSLSLNDPKLFRTDISSTSRIFTEKEEEFNKDFGTESYGLSQEFLKKLLKEKLTLNISGSYVSQKQYSTDSANFGREVEEIFETRNIMMLSPSITFRTTDSYIRPTRGNLTTAEVDVSNGLNNDLDDFIKYRLDSRYYFTPVSRLTFAVRGRYGLIQPYGNTQEVPEDQLFFLGGTATVRGFDENLLRYDSQKKAVGGKEMILGSIEARIDIKSNFELALFFDTGMLARSQGHDGPDDFRSSIGGGLRYLTPIGPISLLYGYKLNPSPYEKTGAFHFSMGYTF